MSRQISLPLIAFGLGVLIVIALLSGCSSNSKINRASSPPFELSPSQFGRAILSVNPEISDTDLSIDDGIEQQILNATPLTSRNFIPDKDWPLTLDQAILIALQDVEVLRDLNANAVNNPVGVEGAFDPAIQMTDPNFGVESALSQFDARLQANVLYAKNDDVFNNPVLGGDASEVRDDVTSGLWSISKTNAFGTNFSINSNVSHSQTNNPNALFSNSWTTEWEATINQPLLQGRGTRFNSIVGPTTIPGQRNTTGVLLARLNQDISLAQFEQGVRSLVQRVTEAYWSLSRAKQNFEAIMEARNEQLKIWNISKARFENDLNGGEADREAQAREQYFDIQARLVTAINGDQLTGQSGILQAEANLRRLLGLPQSDGRLIVPLDEPVFAEFRFHWPDLANQALGQRVELREQHIRTTQRQMELEAAHNFKLPRLDAVATYRNNGFGDDLAFAGNSRFSSALDDAFSNDHAEWEIGLNYDMPIGFRQANAAIKNAELAFRREKAVLKEQRRQILHDLGSSVRQIDQTYSN
ncbi:MAG: TolC family protein, partial [Planctomycetota bacterium]